MPSTPASENPYLLTLPQLISAKKKIGKVATFYDPKKSSFKGFDSQALTPTEFREQLRRNFLVKLSDDELRAPHFSHDADGVADDECRSQFRSASGARTFSDGVLSYARSR